MGPVVRSATSPCRTSSSARVGDRERLEECVNDAAVRINSPMRMASPAPALPKVGDTIAGKYRIVRIIAEGGMGVVYEGVHKRLGQRFAIKVLYPHYSTNPSILTRFDREGRIASRLQGLNSARVFDIDTMPNGMLFLVMELLSGHDLEIELHQKKRLSVAEVADIVSQAAAGMSEAHALGVVHRDLKPANLFLARVPGSTRHIVKVLDFGISRVMHDSQKRVTEDHAQLGTALYMSPEQVRCAADVDARTDIWALGVIMYELLTGVPPFDGQVTEVLVQVATREVVPPRQHDPDIPEEIEGVIMRALERDPAARFQSMDELVDALRAWAPTESVESLALRIPRQAPPTLVEDEPPLLLTKPRTKRTFAIGVAAVTIALGATVLVGVATRAKAAEESASEPAAVAAPSVEVPVAVAAPVVTKPAATRADGHTSPSSSGDAPPPAARAIRRPPRPGRTAAPSPTAAVNPPRL